MAKSSIQWTDYTFNPWIGCSKVSPGCLNCYAEKQNSFRAWGAEWGISGKRSRTSPGNWLNPIKWNSLARSKRKRFRVFCSSLADVFEDRPDLIPIRKDLFELIRVTPNLDWLLLTKRPKNIARMLPEGWGAGWVNVWMGTSTEDQTRYDERIEHLLNVPARIHFLSAEPLLSEIRIQHDKSDGLDWIIVGGESGAGFREMDLGWARRLRDDCESRRVTFFFKQHSGNRPKEFGEELDGKEYKKWPPVERKRGRPKTSLHSRKEQIRLAVKRYREDRVWVKRDPIVEK